MGLAAWVTNAHDRKKYVVSTAKNPLNGVWESVVFEQGRLPFLHGKMVCGVCPIPLEEMSRAGLSIYEVDHARIMGTDLIKGKPVLFFPVESITEAEMGVIHGKVSAVIESSPRDGWRRLLEQLMLEYLVSDERRMLNVLMPGPGGRDISRANWPSLARDLNALLADLRRTWFKELRQHLFNDVASVPKMKPDALTGAMEDRITSFQIAGVTTRVQIEGYIPRGNIPQFRGVLVEYIIAADSRAEAAEHLERLGDPPFSKGALGRFMGDLAHALASHLYGPSFDAKGRGSTFDFVLWHLFFRTQALVATYFGHPDTGSQIMQDFQARTRQMLRG